MTLEQFVIWPIKYISLTLKLRFRKFIKPSGKGSIRYFYILFIYSIYIRQCRDCSVPTIRLNTIIVMNIFTRWTQLSTRILSCHAEGQSYTSYTSFTPVTHGKAASGSASSAKPVLCQNVVCCGKLLIGAH